MIKTFKDLTAIPLSLKVDDIAVAKPPASTTHRRRLEIIEAGKYIDDDKYNSRYKHKDVKEKLKESYKNCCFCEVHDQQLEVEHYRPKSKYYWLAYSWDNLTLSCTKCNKSKSNNFQILGVSAVPKVKGDDLTDIHQLSSVYDVVESPLLINSDKVSEEELNAFIYDEDGSVTSDNTRVKYTIETCGLNRHNLREERKKIWDSFKSKFNARVLEYSSNPEALETALRTLIKDFGTDANDSSVPFQSFRRYVISAGWIQKLLYSLLNN